MPKNSVDDVDSKAGKEKEVMDVDSSDSSFNESFSIETIKQVLQTAEMSIQGHRKELDFSSLNQSQQDRLIELMEKRDERTYQYSVLKVKEQSKVRIKEIDSSIVNAKTNRVTRISVVLGLIALTFVILFFKEQYFGYWVSALLGMLSGFGIAKTDIFSPKLPQSQGATNEVASENEDA